MPTALQALLNRLALFSAPPRQVRSLEQTTNPNDILPVAVDPAGAAKRVAALVAEGLALVAGSVPPPTPVTGDPNSIGFFNPAGSALIDDPALTAAPVAPSGAPQIHDNRQAGGIGSILREGSWQGDGDSTNQAAEGVISYGPNENGVLDATQGAFARMKSDQFGLVEAITGVNGNAPFYFWKIDKTHFLITDAANKIIAEIARPSGTTTLGGDQGAAKLFINQTAVDHGSAADIQISSLVANGSQVKCSQYGANAGVPGVSSLKSRGTTIGVLAAVIAGDILWRATAVGVPADNVSVPLAGLISIIAAFVGPNYVSTDWEIQLVPLAGPINGRKQAFYVTSEGILRVKEAANCMAGIATLDAGGLALIPNTQVKATTKFSLTVQDGGPAPMGVPYIIARAVGVNFTIASNAGAADAGVKVYYQLWEPTTP